MRVRQGKAFLSMAKQQRILVTPRSLTREPHPAVELLRNSGYQVITPQAGRQPGEDELLRLVPECVGYLAGVERVSAAVIAAAPHLMAISRNGVGVDSIDTDAAAAAGIRILTTPGANAEGVAELAIGLMLALVRALPVSDQAIKAGRWERYRGVELQGAVLGVVGCGNIGRRVAQMALGLGMRVVGHDPYPDEAFEPEGFAWVGMDELLVQSRVVSLHSPPAGRPLIDAAALALMPDDAFLVNTARSALVDADAVHAALEAGTLAGYAVDAHDREPPSNRLLVDHARVIATPHIGGYTRESVDRAAMGAARNLLSALQEEADG